MKKKIKKLIICLFMLLAGSIGINILQCNFADKLIKENHQLRQALEMDLKYYNEIDN